MGNHFHLLIRIKDEKEIGFIPITDLHKISKKYNPTNQFKHLFNTYAQSFNRRNDRTGGLFETPFRRILIESEAYFSNVVMYIHNNPVHHGFCAHANEYPWSSYGAMLTDKLTKLKREIVIDWFGGIENYQLMHCIYPNIDDNLHLELDR